MKRSTQRILTTHVGSLARPDALVPLLKAQDLAQPYDKSLFERLVREAVTEVVKKQCAAGVDVVTDGEQSKSSFYRYVLERFNGFERRPPTPDQVNARARGREFSAFPEFYAWAEKIAEWAGGRNNDRNKDGIETCTRPISYRGQGAIARDLENLKTALKGQSHEEVFVPAISAPYIYANYPNLHYRTGEEYEQALCDAAREEYRAIVDAGFIVQIDDPRLVTYYMMTPGDRSARAVSHGEEALMDTDLDGLSREDLVAEVKKLRQGIRTHRDSTGQDLCWHHPALWSLLPEKTDPLPVVPKWSQFLQGCIRYRESLDEQLPAAPRSNEPYRG